MVTGTMDFLQWQEHFLLFQFFYKEALQSPFASQWQAAMDEEFNSLITNKTWKLTHLPPGRKAIRCKWVNALKTKPDGSIDCFKARLVAKA